MRVLIVNSGSSTLKLTLLSGEDDVLGHRELDSPRGAVGERALEAALGAALLGELAGAQAVGHRIVHGGERFPAAVRVDAKVRGALSELTELAPLHQPRGLSALESVAEALPELPQIACFDTAFHAQMPAAAATYALPERWRKRWGVRRYGFHGLSHAWVARRVPQLLTTDEELRIVSCHLGSGASLCAIHGGRSRDCTMGFTPLDGLVMATRSGSLDPALVLWLLERPGIDARSLEQTLEHDSGLLALGGSADMRVLLERPDDGDANARLALDVYIHRLRAGIAAMTAALGGIDVLVFTGGVGQNSAAIRDMTTAGLGFLGVETEEKRGGQAEGDRDISAHSAVVCTLVVNAREDLEMARQVRAVLHNDA
ncbi:MAG TPA: acetate/propionate family kinase [Solirubrobacteraceae bacterium]